MNDLTARLRKLADLLDDKGAELEGRPWNAAVSGFGKALTKFELAAGDASKGLAPGFRDLCRILESPDKKVLDEAAMKKLFKDILGTRAPQDLTAVKLRNTFLAEVKKTGQARTALKQVQEIINDARAPREKPSKDADKLRLELHRLGTLDDEQQAYELGRRFSDKADLKRLADAAGLPVAKDAKKAVLAAAILTAAKRVARHVI